MIMICFDFCIFSKILTPPKHIEDKDKDEIFASQHKICKDRQRSGLDSVSNIFHFIMFLSQYIFLDHFDFNFFHVLRNTMLIEDNFTLFAPLHAASISINQSNHVLLHLDCGAHTVCSKSSFFGQS